MISCDVVEQMDGYMVLYEFTYLGFMKSHFLAFQVFSLPVLYELPFRVIIGVSMFGYIRTYMYETPVAGLN